MKYILFGIEACQEMLDNGGDATALAQMIASEEIDSDDCAVAKEDLLSKARCMEIVSEFGEFSYITEDAFLQLTNFVKEILK